MSGHSIEWDAPWTTLACRVLFRERGEGETPEAFMREYARSSPYGHEQACRVVERLASNYRALFPSGRIAWMWMSSETRRRRERRAWAVWDRKRRARRKR